MSVQTKSNNPESVNKLRHDLGMVLGNLRAFEHLFFSAAGGEKRSDYKETYGNLMSRLDEIIGRMGALQVEPMHERPQVEVTK